MTTDLQSRIAAIKAECEEIIRLDKLATAGPWMPHSVSDEHSTFDFIIDDCECDASSAYIYDHNAHFIAHSRNVSPAMARVVMDTISRWEHMATEWSSESGMLAQIALEEIANQWEGK